MEGLLSVGADRVPRAGRAMSVRSPAPSGGSPPADSAGAGTGTRAYGRGSVAGVRFGLIVTL
ncbi:hypothetical protein GCM10017778_46710 [Streptomyces vinaceus]|nr:hypothetical protein GCM10017778_46710 [Streptomyces vinaceus]